MRESAVAPAWEAKLREGKMFQRFACDRCGTRFPRCPLCGDMGAHPDAA